MDSQVDPSAMIDLEPMFLRYGWDWERIDATFYRTGFRGTHDAYPVFIRLTQHWVVFTIRPLLDEQGEIGPATLQALAQANHQSNLVKFGLDPEGDAFVTVELPSEGFEYSHFQDALSAISHTTDSLAVPFLQAQSLDRLQAH